MLRDKKSAIDLALPLLVGTKWKAEVWSFYDSFNHLNTFEDFAALQYNNVTVRLTDKTCNYQGCERSLSLQL